MNEIKILFYKNLDYLEQRKFIDSTKNREYIFDKFYVEYQKNYNEDCDYKNLAFEIKDSSNIIFCPLTIETKNSENNLNFFGKPIVLCTEIKKEKIFQYELIKVFTDIIKKNSISNFILKKYINDDEVEMHLQNESDIIDAIYTENQIDLNMPLNKILNGFSKGHKSSVKKNYPDLSYHIYDHTNYKKGQIIEMMNLHQSVSSKKTRSKNTWLVNEKMILNKQGFLIKVMNKDKLISYAFFFHNKFYAIYFSSCTDRDNFSSFTNITHKTIWKAIEYLKNINCRYLTLGHTRTLYFENVKIEERSSIERFTASFGGHQQNYIVYKKMPKKI